MIDVPCRWELMTYKDLVILDTTGAALEQSLLCFLIEILMTDVVISISICTQVSVVILSYCLPSIFHIDCLVAYSEVDTHEFHANPAAASKSLEFFRSEFWQYCVRNICPSVPRHTYASGVISGIRCTTNGLCLM